MNPLTQLEARFPGGEIRISLQDVRTVRSANGRVVSMAHRRIHLQLALHIPWGTVVLDPERYACIPGSDNALYSGRVSLGNLGLNLNN